MKVLLRTRVRLCGMLVRAVRDAVDAALAEPLETLRHAVAAAPAAGLVLEFGVATGTTLAAIAEGRQGKVYGFDSFTYPGWQEHEHRAWREHVESHSITDEHVALTLDHEQVAVRVLPVGSAAA